MKKILLYPLILSLSLIPLFASANVEDLQRQIASLLAQIETLRQKISEQSGQSCFFFSSDLQIGNNGVSVGSLQRVLTKEGFSIDNGEVSSTNFGESTASAVVGFQEKYRSEILSPAGLARGTGYVGARTRAKLNSLGCNTSSPSTTITTPVQTYVNTTNYTNTSTNTNKAPTISYISPTSVKAGDTIYVYGSNFNSATFVGIDGANGSTIAPPSTSIISSDKLSFVVPNYLTVGTHTVSVAEKVGPWDLSSPVSFNVVSDSIGLPSIISTSAKAAGNFEMDAGGDVIINGNNLYSFCCKYDSRVFFGGMEATIISTTLNALTVKVPDYLIVGQTYDMYVTTYKGTSNVVKVKILSNITQPSIHISAVTTGQTSDVYANANKSTQFSISGSPINLNLAGNNFSRAFFGPLSDNNCSNNLAEEKVWTLTCTANVTGSGNYYIEIYHNGQTYRSNTVTVYVNP